MPHNPRLRASPCPSPPPAACSSQATRWPRSPPRKNPTLPAAHPSRSTRISKIPNLDVDAFVKRFESESREVYNKREQIAGTLGP